MIHDLQLNGFKSFVAEEIELRPLTVLTGLNSSGKSSVIQALLLLEKAARNEPIYLPGHGSLNESTNPYVTDGLSISALYGENGRIGIFYDTRIEEVTVPFPHLIYVSADRYGPLTMVSVEANSARLGNRGENIFKCIEDNADKLLPGTLRHDKSEGDTFLFNLRAWLSIISPNVKFESFIQVKSDSSYATFNGYRAKNVGFGLSYTLTVITALLLGCVQPGSVVMIENPEAHLHPRGQTEMARLIALCADAGVQVIIETHSDHLFDGIRHYVKKKPEFKDSVIAYWFELDNDGNTDVTQVKMDEQGRVAQWPAGMFDQFVINARKLL